MIHLRLAFLTVKHSSRECGESTKSSGEPSSLDERLRSAPLRRNAFPIARRMRTTQDCYCNSMPCFAYTPALSFIPVDYVISYLSRNYTIYSRYNCSRWTWCAHTLCGLVTSCGCPQAEHQSSGVLNAGIGGLYLSKIKSRQTLRRSD